MTSEREKFEARAALARRARDLRNEEGLSFRDVGARMGVPRERARGLFHLGQYLPIDPDDATALLTDDTPLRVLRSFLSPRPFNALFCAGCQTVGDARSVSDAELMVMPGFGVKSLRELRAVIGAPTGPTT